MPPTYSLRPATDEDYDFLYRLHITTMRAAIEATWGWDETFQADYFRSHWNPAKRQIVMVDGREAGVLTLEQRPEAIFLALIEIHPHYQGQGLGTALIRQVMATAHRQGFPVELHVLKASTGARRLYEQLGFIITGERPDRYIMTAPVPGL